MKQKNAYYYVKIVTQKLKMVGQNYEFESWPRSNCRDFGLKHQNRGEESVFFEVRNFYSPLASIRLKTQKHKYALPLFFCCLTRFLKRHNLTIIAYHLQ